MKTAVKSRPPKREAVKLSHADMREVDKFYNKAVQRRANIDAMVRYLERRNAAAAPPQQCGHNSAASSSASTLRTAAVRMRPAAVRPQQCGQQQCQHIAASSATTGTAASSSATIGTAGGSCAASSTATSRPAAAASWLPACHPPDQKLDAKVWVRPGDTNWS